MSSLGSFLTGSTGLTGFLDSGFRPPKARIPCSSSGHESVALRILSILLILSKEDPLVVEDELARIEQRPEHVFVGLLRGGGCAGIEADGDTGQGIGPVVPPQSSLLAHPDA